MASTPVSTTSATSLPGQLVMVAQGLQAAELAYNTANAATIGFTAVNNVTIDTDFEAGTMSVTATIPISFAASANGVVATATDYL